MSSDPIPLHPWDNPIIPEDVPDEVIPEEAVMHKWLYSVVPAGEEYNINDWENGSEIRTEFPLRIFLVAYCKNCDQVISKSVPYGSGIALTSRAGIPQFGCVDPLAGL